ncbi:hypothetical protein RUM43_014963 [Polyplax serrata]|uniref:Uncharacterized protein n=1 Tax=Polyplax serrata TaxID=468196 RepID=A0AAN8S6B2_POLSC
MTLPSCVPVILIQTKKLDICPLTEDFLLHLSVFLNSANLIAENETRLEEADLLCRQAISMRPVYTQAYINRLDILLKLNRTKEAQEVYERALSYDSNNPDIYYNDASKERVYFNLGMLAMDDHAIRGAERWFRLAVQLQDDFSFALFNLALLADDHRPLEAATFLNQLVRYHPDHIKGLILLDLGAAENCHRKVLQLDPENIRGLRNLCVVHVERGNLEKAEICLRKAFKLAPKEEYIKRHLKIVQQRLAKLETSTKSFDHFGLAGSQKGSWFTEALTLAIWGVHLYGQLVGMS